MKDLSQNKVLTILILVAAVWICLLLGMRVQGMMCEGVYVLSFQQEGQYFSFGDLSGIEREGVGMTFAQPVYPEVSNGFHREEMEVFLTNDKYAYIANDCMQQGTFLNEAQIRKGLSIAVLSEGAARRFFGNRECIGENIYLNDAAYQIVGIIKEQDIETAKVYIPYSTIEYIGITELKIGQLWCRFSSLAEVSAVVKKLGYPVETLNILQMDSVKNVFWQRFDLLLFLTGVYGVLQLCRKYKRKVNGGKTYRDKLSGEELCTGKICLIGVSIILLWKLAAASWCVPAACELLRGSWKDMLYGILNFYFLINVKVDNMHFLTHCNVFSLFFMTVYLYLFPFIMWKSEI